MCYFYGPLAFSQACWFFERASSSLSRHRLVIIRQRDDYPRAFAARTRDLQRPAHLFDALSHSVQTEAIMSIFDFKSITVVTKLEAKLLCIADQPCFKIARVRVLKRIGQGFLSDMQKILLPNQREIAQLAPKLECRVKGGSGSCVLDGSF
jgi:hypothetical protein